MIKNETIFQKLKTEIIPMKKDDFVSTIENLVRGEADAGTVVDLLAECFQDDESIIRTLINKGDSPNLQGDAAEAHKLLVADMQSKFQASINKKFTKKYMEERSPEYKKDDRVLVPKSIKISDIKIMPEYKNLLPSGYKIGKVWEYYKKNDAFPIQIVLDKNGYLIEGYAKYLICKALDITDVLCYFLQ
jgi:hypothetical protein